MTDLLESIRRQNLGAYESMPSRVDEDANQESQISQDYRGRLTFELLQNADDAMGDGGFAERIVFRLTDDALEVGNSGRPLSDDDVRGLCGTGASSKTAIAGRRRASIGHKGMGFKSVLEITDEPEVISTTIGFKLDATESLPAINAALGRHGMPPRRRVPTMRLPWPLAREPAGWEAAQGDGLQVLFRFPLRQSLSKSQRTLLARRLLDLPVTAALFLKHLDDVEVDVSTSDVRGRFRWRLKRERLEQGQWIHTPGFGDSGVYRIRVSGADGADLAFLVAHDADVEIGSNRNGLDVASWDDIDLTEVSIAVPWSLAETRPSSAGLPANWAKFHVFLPTAEAAPYPLLINGAFRTDLSRQEVRIGEDDLDYNRHLLRETARTFAQRLIPALTHEGVAVPDVLALVDRSAAAGSRATGSAAAVLHEAMRRELGDVEFIPGEDGLRLRISELVVPPPTSSPGLGAAFRATLPSDATFGDRWFPTGDMCDARLASILVDFGAQPLSIRETAVVLAGANPIRSRLQAHPTLGERLQVDPVLDVLGRFWAELRGRERTELERAARETPLFPVGLEAGITRRARSDSVQCFYPPRTLVGEVPLTGLQFMLQQVCWGDLTARERTDRLHDEMAAWQALFGIREFKFPDVMRASVFPALELEPGDEGKALRVRLQDANVIAAICQLAGRTANAGSPLPYERLGTNRALFNLSRLRIQCRNRANDIERWEPAYRVYFGSDWVGEDSVEHVLDAMRQLGLPTPDIAFLAPPNEFVQRLAEARHIRPVAADDQVADDIEVGEQEDEDAALESNDRERALNFFTWLGVNRVLRPVSFHDVMDAGSGWLSTGGLSKPKGWAFANLGGIWDEYARYVGDAPDDDSLAATRYFYGLHDLEHVSPLLSAASRDETGAIARALYAHLARGWPQLSAFARLVVAVSSDKGISKRTPPKPNDEELRLRADNFWLYRLRSAPWVPSTQGPRAPGRVWMPSAEIDRRFGRRGAIAGELIPLLEMDHGVPSGRVETLSQRLGVRGDLSPATFLEADARDLLRRLKFRFEGHATDGSLDERQLREIVRPAYRNLLELLAAPSGEDDDMDVSGQDASLGDEPVLVRDGRDGLRFVSGRASYYVARSGTLIRIGQPPINTFILETSVTARRALRQLGIRTLEDVLTWSPEPGAIALDEDELNAFHTGLSELAPYVLARLRVDRSDDRTASRDATRLRELLGAITPVESLSLRCELDGQTLVDSGSRDSHVAERADGSLEAYVRWGLSGWPPSRADANAMASVFVDAMGAGAFEAYLALITADDPGARQRLLTYAGATTNLREFRDLLYGPMHVETPTATVVPWDGGRTTVAEDVEWLGGPTAPPGDDGGSRTGRIPLYRPEQLQFAGGPTIVAGVTPIDTRTTKDKGDGSAGGRGASWGQTGTNLDELNAVGMSVALTFERHRLQLAGTAGAAIFMSGAPADNAFVFDVSTPTAIKAALRESGRFRQAHAQLVSLGLSADYPGFDILTLDPVDASNDRFIELKSSGVDAQVQAMTWNEWKTSRDSTLRTHFYLYLVSNLRSDLGNRTPYLRAVRDPFGSLLSRELVEDDPRRVIQLRVQEFERAEHQAINVLPVGSAGPGAGS
ncbi:MAG: DUF3883 domain-containing protein [Chloroflexota bacterium]